LYLSLVFFNLKLVFSNKLIIMTILKAELEWVEFLGQRAS